MLNNSITLDLERIFGVSCVCATSKLCDLHNPRLFTALLQRKIEADVDLADLDRDKLVEAVIDRNAESFVIEKMQFDELVDCIFDDRTTAELEVLLRKADAALRRRKAEAARRGI